MRKNHLTEGGEKNPKSSMKREDMSNTSSGVVQDLGNVLVKHSSKLEKEINEEKKKLGSTFDNTEGTKHSLRQKDVPKGPSLDECLVKHVSRFEREIQEAKNRRKNDLMESRDASNAVDSLQDAENMDENDTSSLARGEQVDKENVSLNGNAGWDSESSLDSILVKPIHRLEREKMQASPLDMGYKTKSDRKKEAEMVVSNCDPLDKVLVKHVSRLEKENFEIGSRGGMVEVKRKDKSTDNSAGSLDQILVKHQSRLEKEKANLVQQLEDRIKQHFHHLEQYGIDLILGCNGFIWVGEHIEVRDAMVEDQETKSKQTSKSNIKSMSLDEQEQSYTPLEKRQNIIRIANAIRVLSSLGFSLNIEVIKEIVDMSASTNLNIHEMLGAEFYVQVAEKVVERRSSS